MAQSGSSILNLLLADLLKKSNSPKEIVIELYSSFTLDTFVKQAYDHELLSNKEIGQTLRTRINQKMHFIYSLNPNVEIDLQKEGFQPLNLTSPTALKQFLKLLNPGDSVIIVAQGNLEESKVADLDADAFIELIQEDLELSKLVNLEIYSCMMGYATAFRLELTTRLAENCQFIVTYKAVLAANELGRVFIECSDGDDDEGEEAEDTDERQGDYFYSEEHIDRFRVIDKTKPLNLSSTNKTNASSNLK
ncbi:hypothetical protein [Legionella cardiaca]|uniref:Dot/Icm T4SS effector n=1 Tax=Legionella cardiaca TaxID=1071983 RepID=A0ABY8ANQ2_9GAMM|nr:hypothetical protein [Legionella cardiaca]WED42318.1 hypothetical protein PXX05_10315 [Legionella cardiaca]